MDDWWLKVQRAEKHMADIKQEAVRYASRNPYSFTRIRLPDSQNQIKGRFRITEQPDPMIAVMFGDFLHNLRSALDYVVVACVPKQRRAKASFPILFQNIFAKDKNGEFVVKDAQLRENFETATKGLHLKARELVIKLQPYHRGVDAHRQILGIISRLENANKHRQLITIGCAGRDFDATLTVRGFPKPIKLNRPLARGEMFLKDNTVILYTLPSDVIPFVQPSDVEVHFTGTAKIMVRVTRTEGNQPNDDYLLDDIMDMALFNVREIITKLEFFVRRT